MRFAVGIPSIVAAEALVECVAAVMDQDIETDILVVQNGSPVASVCDQLETLGVSIYRPGINLGCSGAWNYACKWAWARGHDKIMLLNDDFIIQDRGGLRKIEEAIAVDGNAHYHFQGFTSACIRKELWDMVGEFDENLYPAYFEDNDYYMRSILLGIDWKIVEIEKKHYGSLSTQKSVYLQMINSRSFLLNQKYYVAKWGGMPHNETFTTPWNGGEPLPGTKELLIEMGWTKFYD